MYLFSLKYNICYRIVNQCDKNLQDLQQNLKANKFQEIQQMRKNSQQQYA